MSKWDNLKIKVSEIADKTAKKTRELTDTAALKIKIANKEADRDIEYKKLGKLAYAKLKPLDEIDSEALTAGISEAIAKLDIILEELEALKAEDEARKEAKAAEKAAKKNIDDDEELNTKVMEEFNEARKMADVAYEYAKEAADDAKKSSDNANID